MEIKYKKLIFNSNTYFDLKTKEVILPISPKWNSFVKWKNKYPKEYQRIKVNAYLQQRNQRYDEEWRIPTIVKKGDISTHTWKYKSGKIKTTQEFKDDLPHGKRINYHQNGNKVTEESFSMGTKHGEQKFYNEDESIQSMKRYERGLMTYECSYSKHRKPQVIKEINYVDGKMHGRLLDCFVNGKKRTEGIMNYDEMTGRWDFYMNDGKTLELALLMYDGRIYQVLYQRYHD